MPDPSAQQLHDVMQPVWEAWEDLRPMCLELKPAFPAASFVRLQEVHWIFDGRFLPTSVATALCRDAMVQGLLNKAVILKWYRTHQDGNAEIRMNGSGAVGVTNGLIHAKSDIEALAAACIAVKAAAQEPTDARR